MATGYLSERENLSRSVFSNDKIASKEKWSFREFYGSCLDES